MERMGSYLTIPELQAAGLLGQAPDEIDMERRGEEIVGTAGKAGAAGGVLLLVGGLFLAYLILR